jgi:DNA (cytosine-5)-methyltransferase 1
MYGGLNMLRVLDLFAGAGGLSLGFEQTGKYKVSVAVEKNKCASATYLNNHSDVTMIQDISEIIEDKEFDIKHGPFEVIIGGPPCQGFSNANRQKNLLINQNNILIKQFVQVILDLKPIAFVFENVKMLTSKTHRFYLTNTDDKHLIAVLKDKIQDNRLILLDVKSPINNLEIILSNYDLIRTIILSESLFLLLKKLERKINCSNTRKFNENKNVAFYNLIKCLEMRQNSLLAVAEDYLFFEETFLHGLKAYLVDNKLNDEFRDSLGLYIKVQRMFRNFVDLINNNISFHFFISQNSVSVEVKSYSVIDYINHKLKQKYEITDGILNAAEFGAPQIRERYISIGILKGNITGGMSLNLPGKKFTSQNFRTVHDAIFDLENIKPFVNNSENSINKFKQFNLENSPLAELMDCEVIYNHVVTDSREEARKRFSALEQGQNFHDLDVNLILGSYSKPERTQNSIYRRLNYSKPSSTVINVRKSMWVHPTIDRAISIREAARLQTFPDSYQFVGTKDSQYQQIGNAVPPIMAKAIAEKLLEHLEHFIT